MKKDRRRDMFALVFNALVVFAGVLAIVYGSWLHLFFALFMILIVLLPRFSGDKKIRMPSRLEIFILLFVIVSLYLSQIASLHAYSSWEIFLQFLYSIIFGAISFLLIILLNTEKSSFMSLRPSFISLFAFTFSVAVGTMWEMFESLLVFFFDISIQQFGVVTIRDIGVNIIGAFIISFIGYMLLKHQSKRLMEIVADEFAVKNPSLFKDMRNSVDYILKMISTGEHDKLEFKSTLRTNLYTKEYDKNMELSVLKTIVAYLNSEGGTLLVGVSDTGTVIGVEKDGFGNKDRFYLYFTNMIKHHIGNQYLPHIKFQLINIEGKDLLKVDCNRSNKQVFLKINNKEEFYMRVGPSSVKIDGSKLIDYVQRRFRR